MNLKTRIATIATAAVLAVSAAGGALAESSQVTQEITGGGFTYSLSDGEMTTIAYDPTRTQNVVTNGELTLTVNDARGTREGWTVSIRSSEFVYSGNAPGNNNINADKFQVEPRQPTGVNGSSTNGMSQGPNGYLHSAVQVLKAPQGSGSGEFEQRLPVKLTVPAQAPAGTYTATITVETNTAPGT